VVSSAPTASIPAPLRKQNSISEVRVAEVLFSPALKEDGDEVIKDADPDDMDDDNEHEEEDDDVFNPYLFISGLPPHGSVVIKDKVCLPTLSSTGTSRPTLALDLDETLVHCTVEPIAKPDLTFPVTFNGTFYQVYVRKRPYLDYFLETVSKSFEVKFLVSLHLILF
jgi:CTD small phosphatase-like protein 2